MRTTYLLKQLISLVLPITVLVLVPMSLERNFTIGSIPAFAAGLLVMTAGLSVLVVTVYTFVTRGNGSLAPWFPTGKLVITGLYRYVRNPMIIGVLLVLLGESLAILSWKILKWAMIFFLINQAWFLLFEEPSLEKRFGDEYRHYKKMVPRWIPAFRQDPSEGKEDAKTGK